MPYGFFDHVPHTNFTGGHVSVGGIFYRADQFPAEFRDRYIAADLLGHAINWHKVQSVGSSFHSEHGGELLRANDSSFAPSDVTLGPDGCVYVADWNDARTAHPDPDADWDRSTGRIYRISYGAAPVLPPFDLSRKTSLELVQLLDHSNIWFRRTAQRMLAERRDPAVLPTLQKRLFANVDERSLWALWALYVSGGFEDEIAARALHHANADVRRWAVRLLGDENRVSPSIAHALQELAAQDPSAFVRSQLACTARRLPVSQAIPIIRNLVVRDVDYMDPQIPLLLWWALERHAIDSAAALESLVARPEFSKTKLARETLVPRLVRRLAAEGSAQYGSCAGPDDGSFNVA